MRTTLDSNKEAGYLLFFRVLFDTLPSPASQRPSNESTRPPAGKGFLSAFTLSRESLTLKIGHRQRFLASLVRKRKNNERQAIDSAMPGFVPEFRANDLLAGESEDYRRRRLWP